MPHAFIAKLLGAAIIIITFILRQKWAMRTQWGWDRIDFIYACTFCIGFAFLVDGFKYVKKALAFRRQSGNRNVADTYIFLLLLFSKLYIRT